VVANQKPASGGLVQRGEFPGFYRCHAILYACPKQHHPTTRVKHNGCDSLAMATPPPPDHPQRLTVEDLTFLNTFREEAMTSIQETHPAWKQWNTPMIEYLEDQYERRRAFLKKERERAEVERGKLEQEYKKVNDEIDEQRNLLRKVGNWQKATTTSKPENPNSGSGPSPQPPLPSYRQVIPTTRGVTDWDENILSALDPEAWLTDVIVNFGTWFHPALD
jgi:hypothetical protein